MLQETLVPAALEYYDRTQEKFKDLFKKIASYKRETSPLDMERNRIIAYDISKNVVLVSKYEVIGIHSNLHKIWCWAWSVPTLAKNAVYISRKILNYGLDIESSMFLKTELTTSRFVVSDKIQMDLHIAIACYLAKKVVYKVRYNFKEDEKTLSDDSEDKKNKNYIDSYIFLLDIDPDQDISSIDVRID
jgi:hypothetical protein